VARLFRTLAGDRAGTIRRSAEPRLYRTTTYEIDVPPAAEGPPRKPGARCDRRMELRAAFLACGSLAAPAHGYHLEFAPGDGARAERLMGLFDAAGTAPKTALRKGKPIVYLKDLDAIVAVLSAIGAFGAVLHLEDVRAMKETKNRIHRLVNTEAANVDRSTAAAAMQAEAIGYLAEAYGLRNVTAALREAAQLRLAHPDESLLELGRRTVPPVGKATMNGRIASLVRLARRLRGNDSGAGSSRVATSLDEEATRAAG
jgi:DNA-binding protein WhiA